MTTNKEQGPIGFVVRDIPIPESLNALLGLALKGSDGLLQHLYQDDSFYQSARYSLVQEEDAKKLLLYGFTTQAKKALYATIQKLDFIAGPFDGAEDLQGRTTIAAIDDEQRLWIRKLMEVLVDLINFSTTDRGWAYRAYMTAENLELFRGKQKDLLDFFKITSKNVQESINEFTGRLKQDLNNAPQGIWFIDADRLKGKSAQVFHTIRKRYMLALGLADADEQLLLGDTYNSYYSRLSSSMHGGAGSPVADADSKSLMTSAHAITLLALHVLDRASGLAGFDNPQSVKRILTGGSIAPSLVALHKQSFQPGDIVIANGHLAEVLERINGMYDYTSYKVQYLVRAPMPGIDDEDYLSSDHIQVLCRKDKARDFFEKNTKGFETIEGMNEVLKQDSQFFYDSMKSFFIELEKKGVLLKVLAAGRKEARDAAANSTTVIDHKSRETTGDESVSVSA